MKKGEIKKIIDSSLGIETQQEELVESFVARPKQYDLKTEMLLAKTKEAHDKLYQQYIEDLNTVSAKMDTVSRREANPNSSDYRSLKHNEQYLVNAVWLHELFFANIGAPFSEIEMDSYSFMRISRDFGTFEDWQKDFIACAMSCSSGWAVCGINMFLKTYTNIIIDGHSDNVPVGFFPILVLDLWEHSRRDYLNDKKAYVYAMMKEINWNIVEERVRKADMILKVIQ